MASECCPKIGQDAYAMGIDIRPPHAAAARQVRMRAMAWRMLSVELA